VQWLPQWAARRTATRPDQRVHGPAGGPARRCHPGMDTDYIAALTCANFPFWFKMAQVESLVRVGARRESFAV
jgi:hypothetical protein